MACKSCGAGRPKHNEPKMEHNPYPADNLGMKAFLVSMGWSFVGNCNCTSNAAVYVNPTYPQFQIWVSRSEDLMTIKKKFSQVDLKTTGAAGKANYKDVYYYHLVTNINKFNV